jgi:hypothetical protein
MFTFALVVCGVNLLKMYPKAKCPTVNNLLSPPLPKDINGEINNL